MNKNGNMQTKLLQDFLKRHFKTRKVKFKGKFKRAIIGYNGKTYQPSDRIHKVELTTHLIMLLDEVFGFKESIIKKVVNRFI